MGSVFRRKDSKFWYAKWYQNGRPVQRSTGAVTKREAERFLKLREGAVAKGAPIPMRFDRILYDELAGDLCKHYDPGCAPAAVAQEVGLEDYLPTPTITTAGDGRAVAAGK